MALILGAMLLGGSPLMFVNAPSLLIVVGGTFGAILVAYPFKDVFGSSRIARFKGEYVRVKGRVAKWHNRFRNRDELQIVVSLPTQIKGSDKVPDFTKWHPEKPRGEKHY